MKSRTILGATLLALIAKTSFAQSFWNGSTSNDWNNPANWSAGYPVGGNAIVNPNGGTFSIPTISANAAGVFDVRINDTGTGTATMNQTAGTLTVKSWFRVGTTAGGTGVFNLSGGTDTITGPRVHVGESGIGIMNISGGTLTASGTEAFLLATDPGSSGTVNQTGGTVNKTNGWFTIGQSGNGTYGISAGSLSAASDFNVSDFAGSTGRLNVSGTGLVTSTDFLYVGKNGGATGIVDVAGGTINANYFALGGHSSDSGAVGNSFVTVHGVSAQINTAGQLWVGEGNGSNGLMNVNAGTVSSNSWLVVGRDPGGYGVLNVSGSGNVRMTAGSSRPLIIGSQQANGVLNMTGGTVEAPNGGAMFLSDPGGSGAANLGGGTLKVDAIATFGGASRLYLNGGTMQARISTTTYLEGLTSAIVGGGGAVFDTNGNNITVNQNLSAPSGSGVISIPVISGGIGYPAQPIVKLTGGGGTGATAIANVIGGIVTSITITNPGIGYTSAPTVTIIDGGATTAATFGSPVIAANTTTGGLTKTGNGTLSLTGTNSYAGTTNVNGGVLAASGSYSSGFAVNTGGHLTALDGAVGTLTVPTLALGAGSAVDIEFGTGNDLINISDAGGLTIGSTDLYLYQAGGTLPFMTDGTYTIFDYNTFFNGTLSTSFSFANSQVGKVYSLTNNLAATTIELTIADVPEPGSLGLFGLGTLLLAARRRRSA